mgnify:CR=1 FL=1
MSALHTASSRTVIIYIFNDGSKLIKNKCTDNPVYCRMAQLNGQWRIVNQLSDIGHVANLLVKSGYLSEHLPAIELLNAL